ncbi:MAG: leucine-rich repeat domain-containing protein [Chloroflexota bacterium]
MRYWFAIIVLIMTFGIASAQEDTDPYQIALARIEEARITGANELLLVWLDLEEIPPEIGSLQQLQVLSLVGNRLTDLPSEITNLQALQTISLASNNLAELPIGITTLSSLTTLDLYDNNLAELPPEIGSLPNLLVLNVESNQLSGLPTEIINLSNLEMLNLRDNNFQSLPNRVSQLTTLCHLDIRQNNIKILPATLHSLNRLANQEACPFYADPVQGLEMDRSTLSAFPSSVVNGGTPAILDYLENRALWHTRRIVIAVVSSVSSVAFVIVCLWSHYRRRRKPKQKRHV